MTYNPGAFWSNYLSKVQLDLSIAAYSKVKDNWQDRDYVPDYNKLYFIIDGEGYLKIGEREYYPKPNQLFLMPANVMQSYQTISENTFSKYWCHFTAAIDSIPLFRLVGCADYVAISEPDLLKDKFEQLVYWQHQDKLSSGLRIRAILLEIIAVFLENNENVRLNSEKSGHIDKIQEVMQYIEAHLSDNISLEQISQIAHFHPNYLIRLFKETTGLPPIQYMNRLRMERAKSLLNGTAWTISAVADAIGMENSYFSRMFKEYTGVTPTEYRDLLS